MTTQNRTREQSRRPGWPVPVALAALSAIPLIIGALRLLQLAGGPEVIPQQAGSAADEADRPAAVGAEGSLGSGSYGTRNMRRLGGFWGFTHPFQNTRGYVHGLGSTSIQADA